MISIICSSRIDNYEGDSVGRFITSVTENCNILRELNLEYEYIVVEYCPQDEYLCRYERTKHLFEQYNCKDIIFDKSIAIAENLNPNKYYEYFCKNLGIRQSCYNSVLITNADIILTKPLIKEIKKLLLGGLRKDRFYRTRYRSQVDPITLKILSTVDLHNPSFSDAHICGGYSGDFLLIDRQTLIEQGEGYDETNPSKRNGFQINMDGELLHKLHKRGILLEFMKEGYHHIYHAKTRTYDSGRYDESGSYKNKKEWGFVSYKITDEIPDKLRIVHT